MLHMFLSPEARSRVAADATALARAVDKGRSAFMGLRPFSTARDRASLPTRSSLRLGVFARDIKSQVSLSFFFVFFVTFCKNEPMWRDVLE
jgi:hypothetical protein